MKRFYFTIIIFTAIIFLGQAPSVFAAAEINTTYVSDTQLIARVKTSDTAITATIWDENAGVSRQRITVSKNQFAPDNANGILVIMGITGLAQNIKYQLQVVDANMAQNTPSMVYFNKVSSARATLAYTPIVSANNKMTFRINSADTSVAWRIENPSTYATLLNGESTVSVPSGAGYVVIQNIDISSLADETNYNLIVRNVNTAPNEIDIKSFKKNTPPAPVVTKVNPVNTNSAVSDEYTLLAPLPGLSSIKSSEGLGNYLNIILLIVIGIAGALSVVMLVIAGIQYIGSESIFGKTEAKSKIMSTIGGLLLALGSWVLLNTINPDLLGGNGLSIPTQSIDIFTPTAGGGELGVPNITSNNITNLSASDKISLKSAANSTGVECNLIEAFMFAESAGGKNNGPSSVGAHGPMQLMPATFTGLGYDISKIDDHDTNIKAGAKYIASLQKNGCGGSSNTTNPSCSVSNIQNLAAAYNGGSKANSLSKVCPGNTAWQCVQNSGYAQTRTYAPTVEANYKALSNNSAWGCNS